MNLDAAKQCNWVLLPGGSRGNPPVIADPPFWRQHQSGYATTDEEGSPVQVASKIFDLSQKRSRRSTTPIRRPSTDGSPSGAR